MHKKISKNGVFLLAFIFFLAIIATVIFFGKNSQENTSIAIPKEFVGYIVEDETLEIELLDFVSAKNETSTYTKESIVIDDTEIAGVKITETQTFSKYIMLSSPGSDAIKLGNNSTPATHSAYVLFLVGDIAHYKEGDKDIYQIENAYIEYEKQSLLVEEEYNSVYIASLDGKLEKFVTIPEYTTTVESVENYMSMLQW